MSPTDPLAALVDLTVDFGVPAPVGTDDELLRRLAQLAAIRRRLDGWTAALAGEVAARSRVELGSGGLAQRLGARTPEMLLQRTTGADRREARSLVQVGRLVHAVAAADVGDAPAIGVSAIGVPAIGVPATGALAEEPWRGEVAAAVRAGRISIGAADAIRTGLSEPAGARAHPTPTGEMTAAAALLVEEAADSTPERLAARARELRDGLDPERIPAREAALRERRFLHLTPQIDGMTRISGLLDPESAAIVTAAYDAATSPRRGGPRFQSEQEPRVADDDQRSTEQLALDTLVQLVDLGTRADRGALLGVRRPAVQVIVAERDLRSGRGVARLEGQTAAVSVDTAQRQACDAGIVPILFDDEGQAVNVGRDLRLFTERQRKGLAARDGGCRFGDCDRPPSWCEAHHIHPWAAEGGRTDIADGILLCRHHHLLLHNAGWRVLRRGAEYTFVPPPEIDPMQRPRPSRSKSPLLDRLRAAG